MKFHKAWRYLNNHVIFKNQYGWSEFQRCLDIEVVKVNPDTNAIDENPKLNTSTRVWLEAGPYLKDTPTHDMSLDCGAKTFEKAIIKLAKLVKKRYGDDSEKALKKVKKLFSAHLKAIEQIQNKNEQEGIIISENEIYYNENIKEKMDKYHQITLEEYTTQLPDKTNISISKEESEELKETKEKTEIEDSLEKEKE